nr:hypothetical protein [Desulfobacula sp.]
MDYVPYYGSLKGAALTLLDGSGNDFDQASLTIALLRASGHTAQYVFGTMQIPNYGAADQKDMQHWLGVDANNTVIANVMANGGIPAPRTGSNFDVSRVWVRATVNGSTFLFDPAFKAYREIPGINLSSAMAYDRAALLSAAGGTQGTDYIENMSESGLRSVLGTWSTNLSGYIRNHYPNASMEEIIGGREIIPEYVSGLPESLEFSNSPEEYWDEIPSIYAHTIQIRHGEINKTLDIDGFGGKRLSMTYDTAVTANSETAIRSRQNRPSSQRQQPLTCLK